jgi:hypothetical protein
VSGKAKPLFHEEQRFSQPRLRILTAIPPIAMLLLVIWQVVLGHPFGNAPLSNGSVVGWTIFIAIVYVRLNTVKLVTDVLPGELVIAMRGLWRSYHIALKGVQSVKVVSFDPVDDWGGYGRRSTSRGRAYIAGGNRGVELEFSIGGVVVIGSDRPEELERCIVAQLSRVGSPS